MVSKYRVACAALFITVLFNTAMSEQLSPNCPILNWGYRPPGAPPSGCFAPTYAPPPIVTPGPTVIGNTQFGPSLPTQTWGDNLITVPVQPQIAQPVPAIQPVPINQPRRVRGDSHGSGDCDCIHDCCKMVDEPYVDWVTESETILGDDYEPATETKPYCKVECPQGTATCVEIIGTKTVKTLVKRKKEFVVDVKRPVIRYRRVNKCVKCGAVVEDCPE